MANELRPDLVLALQDCLHLLVILSAYALHHSAQ